ncbi:helix-turn-helix domain-containing protein [Microbulbifer sp. GL-2]|uniref:helix-turn-helix domain-containing protein n=1 Tax=Microbulbifer sp. GL-2 TaxID=2591606 RepID=UPI001162E706|nr:hypothetical protein GL2_42580 [Microbulbifer sp. GL-2]
MTGQELANKLGVHPTSLSKMEHGDQAIPAELLADWCCILEVSVSTILYPEGTDRAHEEEALFYMKILSELNQDHRTLVLKHLEMVYKHEKKER